MASDNPEFIPPPLSTPRIIIRSPLICIFIYYFIICHKEWAACFSTCTSAANHPELVKMVQFRFVIPAHNGVVKHIFLLMQSQWTEESNRPSAELVKGILTWSIILRVCHMNSFVLTHVV